MPTYFYAGVTFSGEAVSGVANDLEKLEFGIRASEEAKAIARQHAWMEEKELNGPLVGRKAAMNFPSSAAEFDRAVSAVKGYKSYLPWKSLPWLSTNPENAASWLFQGEHSDNVRIGRFHFTLEKTGEWMKHYDRFSNTALFGAGLLAHGGLESIKGWVPWAAPVWGTYSLAAETAYYGRYINWR